MSNKIYVEAGSRNSGKTLSAIGLYYINLEKEVGCTFETIIEATKNGIIDCEGKEHIVLYGEYYLYAVEDDKLQYTFCLKNYQKTWWLKGEKENEKRKISRSVR